MGDLINLIYNEDPSVVMCNIVALVIIVEFIGCVFGMLGNLSHR